MAGSASTKEEANPPKVLEQDLAGKNAVVTGASRGIGRAIALHLALRGASILGTCSSPSSIQHIDALNSEVRDLYASTHLNAPRIVGLDANLLSAETPQRLADAVKQEFGGALHILVNNAAYDEMRPVGELDAEYIQRSVIGNIQTPVLYMDIFFRKNFFQPDSRIVNIGSEMTRGGIMPTSAFGFFTSTKSAIESMTRTWADVLGKHPTSKGTTVNVLLVGATSTEAFTNANKDSVELVDHIVSRLSVGHRMGTPEDAANVTGLLVSERAGWVTGSVISANGGSGKVL